MNEKTQNQEAVRDARQLGIPKMLILGIQHMSFVPKSFEKIPIGTSISDFIILRAVLLCSQADHLQG